MKIADYRDASKFQDKCHELATLSIDHIAPKKFDLVVGIATGGKYVADAMRNCMPYETDYMVLKRQRSSTKVKESKSILSVIIFILPGYIQNVMRILESRVREARFYAGGGRTSNEELVELISPSLPGTTPQHILVVDDAIDSGSTVKQVNGYLHERFPDAIITVATITTTFVRPAVKPDICLHTSTIAKFPWSLDGSRRKK